MSTTARLSLPYIAPQQAQKQVTYNMAMAALDQLVQPAVLSRSRTAPPAGPAEGDAYIVASEATAAWAGKDGSFAAWTNGAWSFRAPADGWLAWVVDDAELAVFAAGAWAPYAPAGGPGLPQFGINTTADATNRLAVASAASLFTHAGGDHRLNVNKAAAGNTASVIFADGFSGRAELGLAGDDDLHLKVSANGSTWREALTVDSASGGLGLSAGQLGFPATPNLSADAHTLDAYAEGSWTPTVTFGGAAAGVGYNAVTAGRYTRIGRLVLATAGILLSSKGSSTGSAQIGGLPFASADDGIYASVNIGFSSGFTGVSGPLVGLVLPNADKISLYYATGGGVAGLSDTKFTNTSCVYLSVAYHAAG